MTILAIGIIAFAGVSLFLGWYFRRAEAGAVEAGPVWDRVSANLNRFVMDESVPISVARDVTIFASIAGCGCMAVSFVVHRIRKELSKKYRDRIESKRASHELQELGPVQKQLLACILSDLVRIDMLRSPILRPILEAALKSTLAVSSTATDRPRVKDIKTLMRAAHGAADWQMKLRKLPDEVAVLAERSLEKQAA